MGTSLSAIALDDSTRATLQGWLRKQKTPVALAKQARAILLLADGQTFAATARRGTPRTACPQMGAALCRMASTVCTIKNAPAVAGFSPVVAL